MMLWLMVDVGIGSSGWWVGPWDQMRTVHKAWEAVRGAGELKCHGISSRQKYSQRWTKYKGCLFRERIHKVTPPQISEFAKALLWFSLNVCAPSILNHFPCFYKKNRFQNRWDTTGQNNTNSVLLRRLWFVVVSKGTLLLSTLSSKW